MSALVKQGERMPVAVPDVSGASGDEHLVELWLAGHAPSTRRAYAREAALLAPSKGELPTDVGSDDTSKLSLVERAELGGQALRVVRLAGDSFGDRIAKVTDWREFVSLKFSAFNPGTADLKMALTENPCI